MIVFDCGRSGTAIGSYVGKQQAFAAGTAQAMAGVMSAGEATHL